jgi:tRNA pseudouridine13 synthase
MLSQTDGGALDSARAAALHPPRAHGPPPAAARLRETPEDFTVEEDLGFAPSGSGTHWLLRVRKRGANTAYVARQLARSAGCRLTEVGYAGLKDRHAVAVQWFSVPRTRAVTDWSRVSGEEFEVLEAHPHGRKLPRGALAGNAFAVRIRAVCGSAAQLAAALAPRLATLARAGVPNYFGPQRFGREGANLARTRLPLAELGRDERGFVLSAARSVLFNAVLAERVAQGSWQTLLSGDLAGLDGRGSIFAVASLDEELQRRCAELQIHPTGPLWGAGEPPSQGAVRELEMRVGAQFGHESALCSAAGMRQERRSLRLAVRALECDTQEQSVLLRFYLARGSFATAVLRELIETDEDAALAA